MIFIDGIGRNTRSSLLMIVVFCAVAFDVFLGCCFGSLCLVGWLGGWLTYMTLDKKGKDDVFIAIYFYFYVNFCLSHFDDFRIYLFLFICVLPACFFLVHRKNFLLSPNYVALKFLTKWICC